MKFLFYDNVFLLFSSPRASPRLEEKKSKLEPAVDLKFSYRRIERLLSGGLVRLITLLQTIGVLADRIMCPLHPNTEMTFCNHVEPIDGWLWKCTVPSCNKRVSIRRHSFFARSHLKLDQLFILAFAWFQGNSQRQAAEEAELPATPIGRGNKTVSDWYNFCRDVCREVLNQKSEMIGGYGKIVELDESAFGKRNYHRGRVRKTQWVFGGIEQDSNKMFAVTVKDRKRRTLWPIIFKYVRPGSVIYTDKWRSYIGLDGVNDYQHFHVNHTENFVNPDTGLILILIYQLKIIS